MTLFMKKDPLLFQGKRPIVEECCSLKSLPLNMDRIYRKGEHNSGDKSDKNNDCIVNCFKFGNFNNKTC